MKKSAVQVLQLLMTALFFLPAFASAYSVVEVPVYPSGYFDFFTQQSYLNSTYSAGGNSGYSYTFFEGSPTATSTRGSISTCGGSPSVCAPSGYNASSGSTLDSLWNANYGSNAPDGSYWVGFWLPDAGNLYEVDLQYVSLLYKLNGQWFSGVSPVGTSTINWNQIFFPTIFSTSSQAIATGSPLWGSLSLASTSVQCDSGNIFSDGICAAFAYLFVPEPTILNQYVQLFATSSPTGFYSKFPGSYALGISSAFSSLSASSSQNVSLLAFDFPGISTTTPGFGQFIPERIEILSTTTISRYYPDNIRLAMLFLISCGLWLGLATDVFFTVRNRMHKV